MIVDASGDDRQRAGAGASVEAAIVSVFDEFREDLKWGLER